jgi:hypothetical protein
MPPLQKKEKRCVLCVLCVSGFDGGRAPLQKKEKRCVLRALRVSAFDGGSSFTALPRCYGEFGSSGLPDGPGEGTNRGMFPFRFTNRPPFEGTRNRRMFLSYNIC